MSFNPPVRTCGPPGGSRTRARRRLPRRWPCWPAPSSLSSTTQAWKTSRSASCRCWSKVPPTARDGRSLGCSTPDQERTHAWGRQDTHKCWDSDLTPPQTRQVPFDLTNMSSGVCWPADGTTPGLVDEGYFMEGTERVSTREANEIMNSIGLFQIHLTQEQCWVVSRDDTSELGRGGCEVAFLS